MEPHELRLATEQTEDFLEPREELWHGELGVESRRHGSPPPFRSQITCDTVKVTVRSQITWGTVTVRSQITCDTVKVTVRSQITCVKGIVRSLSGYRSLAEAIRSGYGQVTYYLGRSHTPRSSHRLPRQVTVGSLSGHRSPRQVIIIGQVTVS